MANIAEFKEIEAWLKPRMKEGGFKKNRREWMATIGALEAGIWYYKSRYDAEYYLELWVRLPDEPWIPHRRFQFRFELWPGGVRDEAFVQVVQRGYDTGDKSARVALLKEKFDGFFLGFLTSLRTWRSFERWVDALEGGLRHPVLHRILDSVSGRLAEEYPWHDEAATKWLADCPLLQADD